MSPIAAKKILLVKNRAMGDAVIGLGALAYLRELYPDSTIVYAIPSWICPLFKQVETAASEIYPLDLKKASGWFILLAYMRREKFDLVYELFQSGRTGRFFSLSQLLWRAPYYFHNHHLEVGEKVIDQGLIKPVIQRDLDGIWSQLAKRKGEIPKYLDYAPSMKCINSSEIKKRIIFGVVATRDTKMWPFEFYVRLAKLILEKFPNYQISIPLSQSIRDTECELELMRLGIPSEVEFVRQPLEFLPNFLKESQLYIGNDTGLKHIAVAVGLKNYTFFGPEPPLEWHPYAKEDNPFFYRDNLECRTINAHYCGLNSCDSMICLNQILPETVFEAIQGEF